MVITLLLVLILTAWSCVEIECYRRRGQRMIAQLASEITGIDDRLETFRANALTIRFDLARFFSANTVDSTLVAQPLMIEENIQE